MQVVHVHGGRRLCGVSRHIFAVMGEPEATGARSSLLLLRPGDVADEARKRGFDVTVCGPRFPGDPSAIPRLIRALVRLRADVLHTHTINGNVYGRLAACALPRLRVVTTVHTFLGEGLPQLYPNPLLRAFVRYANGLTGRRANLFISICSALDAQLLAAGVPAAGRRLIPNGLDLGGMLPAEESERRTARRSMGVPDRAACVGCMGRLVRVKRIDLLLEAVASLQQQLGKVHILVVGEGPLRRNLEQQAAGLGLGETVHFTGWLGDVRQALLAMDVLAMPSASEALPYSVMEAMAMGVPPVAFGTGGLPDLVSPGCGILVKSGDLDGFGRALGVLLTDARTRSRMSGACRPRIETHFSATGMCRNLGIAYRSLFEGPAACGYTSED